MSKLFSTVKNLWKTKPLFSNCVTYGALYGAAELSQQCLIRKVFVSRIYSLVVISHYYANKYRLVSYKIEKSSLLNMIGRKTRGAWFAIGRSICCIRINSVSNISLFLVSKCFKDFWMKMIIWQLFYFLA